MMEMFLAGITMDHSHSCPIVVLVDGQRQRALPFWISATDASSILAAVTPENQGRPMTHDLLLEMLYRVGWKVECVEINELNGDVLMATVKLEQTGQQQMPVIPLEQSFDARPSDAVALAIKAGAPILVSLEIVATATIPADIQEDQTAQEQFERFVQNLKPSDFNRMKGRGS